MRQFIAALLLLATGTAASAQLVPPASYGPGPASPQSSPIQTVPASGTGEIDFIGIGNYASYRLSCNGLVVSGGGNIGLQFGEGASFPAGWKATNYIWGLYFIRDNGSGNVLTSTGNSDVTQIWLTDNAVGNAAVMSFDVTFGSLGIAGIHNASIPSSAQVYSSTGYWVTGGGAYTGDTNPVTAMRVKLDGGATFTSGSGSSCTLWASN